MVVVIPINTGDFGIYMLQRISDLQNISNIKLRAFEKILLAETGTLEQILTILTNSEVAITILRQKEYHKLIKREARIITNYQLETFRKILEIGYNSKKRSVFRIYHIIHKGKVVFEIKEVFPLNTRTYNNSLNLG